MRSLAQSIYRITHNTTVGEHLRSLPAVDFTGVASARCQFLRLSLISHMMEGLEDIAGKIIGKTGRSVIAPAAYRKRFLESMDQYFLQAPTMSMRLGRSSDRCDLRTLTHVSAKYRTRGGWIDRRVLTAGAGFTLSRRARSARGAKSSRGRSADNRRRG